MLTPILEKLKVAGEVYLAVKVLPNNAKTEIREIMADGTYKIAVAAPPEKGKANLKIINFLAKELAVAKNNIKIIAGAGDRSKLIKITI